MIFHPGGWASLRIWTCHLPVCGVQAVFWGSFSEWPSVLPGTFDGQPHSSLAQGAARTTRTDVRIQILSFAVNIQWVGQSSILAGKTQSRSPCFIDLNLVIGLETCCVLIFNLGDLNSIAGRIDAVDDGVLMNTVGWLGTFKGVPLNPKWRSVYVWVIKKRERVSWDNFYEEQYNSNYKKGSFVVSYLSLCACMWALYWSSKYIIARGFTSSSSV